MFHVKHCSAARYTADSPVGGAPEPAGGRSFHLVQDDSPGDNQDAPSGITSNPASRIVQLRHICPLEPLYDDAMPPILHRRSGSPAGSFVKKSTLIGQDRL